MKDGIQAQRDNLVTVVGGAYFQPIADLIAKLVQHQRPRLNRIQSGYDEHGYSSAIVLLIVAMFESYMSRVRYVQPRKTPAKVRNGVQVNVSHARIRFPLQGTRILFSQLAAEIRQSL